MKAKTALALFQEAANESALTGAKALMQIVRDEMVARRVRAQKAGRSPDHVKHADVFREVAENLAYMEQINLDKIISKEVRFAQLNPMEKAVRFAAEVRKVDLMPEIAPA